MTAISAPTASPASSLKHRGPSREFNAGSPLALPGSGCYRVRTTVNCINGLTGNPPDDQSIDACVPAGTVNRT